LKLKTKKKQCSEDDLTHIQNSDIKQQRRAEQKNNPFGKLWFFVFLYGEIALRSPKLASKLQKCSQLTSKLQKSYCTGMTNIHFQPFKTS